MDIFINLISKIKKRNSLKPRSLFSESVLKTSFYEELQKNEWCNVIADRPDNLIEIVSITIKKTKKV